MSVVPSADVPCNGCTMCCRGKVGVFLEPAYGDRPEGLSVVQDIHPLTGKVALRLRFKENGDCIHLGEAGCEVYDSRPATCRVFDCRAHFALPAAERRRREKLDPGSIPIWRRGRALVEAAK